MTGEQMYRAHRATAIYLEIDESLVPWDSLSMIEKAEWDQIAFNQDLRDRACYATLPDSGGINAL